MPCPWIRSRNSVGRCFAVALVIAGMTTAGVRPGAMGRAQAADSEAVSKAREHYKNGEKAFKAGRFDEALREWEAGYQLSNRPLFLLNMGHAERRRGQLGNARTLYKRFLLMEPETKLRDEIEGVLREIDSALANEDGAGKAPGATAAPQPNGASEPAASTNERDAKDVSLSPPSPAALAAEVTSQDSGTMIHDSPRAEPPPPVWRRWWFWAGAGAVVAAGVVTTVLLRRGDAYTKSGSLGTLGTPP
jgi:hypothetical protein